MMSQSIPCKIICFVLVAFFSFPQIVHCEEQSPDQFLKDFYVWYITTAEGTYRALNDNGIYRYVKRETVEEVKKLPQTYGYDRRDYFLKIFDMPLGMEGTDISVGKVTDMGMDTFVVPVIIATTFDNESSIKDYIIVFIQKIDGNFKIVKCMDPYPEA